MAIWPAMMVGWAGREMSRGASGHLLRDPTQQFIHQWVSPAFARRIDDEGKTPRFRGGLDGT
jgi:hypothetical protein